MKKIFTLLLLNCITATAFCQAWDWTKVSIEGLSGLSIDKQQFFVTGGQYVNEVENTGSYGLLIKRNRNGNMVWQKKLASSFSYNSQRTLISDVATDDNGNIYTSNSDFDTVNNVHIGKQGAVCKFDFNGNLVWSREFLWLIDNGFYTTFAGNIRGKMATDEQNNLYVSGYIGPVTGPTNFSNNKKMIFGTDTFSFGQHAYLLLAKITPAGQLLWMKSFKIQAPHQGPVNSAITSIAIKNNKIAICGHSNISMISFDSINIFPGRGTNFIAVLNAADGKVGWAKNIDFDNQTSFCTTGCGSAPSKLLYNDSGKIVFTGGFMRDLVFAGNTYSIGYRRGYYLAQFDTSGAEERIRFFPDDILGDGSYSSPLPGYGRHSIVKSGKNYYLHLLRHLYKLDSAYNITWTSTNNGISESQHGAMAAETGNAFIGQISGFSGVSTMAGNEVITNLNPNGGSSYLSRINDAYNIISGHLFYDLNGNGTKDPGEPPLKNHPIVATPGNRFVGLSDTAGYYQCLSDTGTFTYRPAYLPLYHTVAPAAGYSITTSTFNITIAGKNFGFKAIPGITDMAVDLVPLSATRPGFTARLNMIVTNRGTTTQSGTASLRLSNQLSFLNANPAPAVVTADSLVFNYGNLIPGATQQYDVTFRVNPVVIFGNQLTSYATVYPVATDTLKPNNYDTLVHPVTGSFDPNDKAVNLDGNVSIDKKGEALEYTIRFQNTGNDTAFNIRIADTLSSKLNIASFELVSSTHPVQPEISKDKVLTFYFDNILLVDSIHNEPKSHGAVQFRIKPIANVQLNDSITNRSSIYFDYNEPVLTNTVKTKYVGYPTVNLGNDITVCGGPVSLNAGNSGARFVWSTGDTLQTISVSNSGTYWVRVTNSYGFSASDTIQVILKPLPVVNLGADITQCGGSVTLNAANPGSSYLWSNGATTQNITVTVSGNYGVKVTNADGCSTSDTIQVTINPLPTVNLGADITQCGGTVTLNAANAGSSYLWNNGATTQTITATASGIYHVKVTNANGCFKSDTIQVTINSLPTVNLGADIVQCGGSATLNAGNTGSSYLWSNGATAQSLTVTTSGTYSVKVTNTSGCSKADTISVTINPVPVVNLGADANFCAGSTVLLDAGNTGAAYLWNTGATSRQLTISLGGAYSVRVTNAVGCFAADTIQLTQRALPVVQLSLPDTLFVNDATVVALVQPAGGQLTGTGITNGRFDAAVAGQGRHTIRYNYTDAFGCSNQATATVVVLTAVDKVKVYPNPNRGNFTVVASRALRSGSLTIVTPAGQVVGRFALTAFVQQVRVSLQPGVYYLKFSNNGFDETRRMLVW
jgi:uncharacterized repeat protein (TIGR01451 family)